MSIKPSLVEHVFRDVWESNTSAAAGDATNAFDGTNDDDSDEEAEFAATTESSNAASSTDPHAAASRVTKISQDALKLSSEYLRLFVVEAFHRAQMEAMVDDSPTIEPHHVEQILAQLLLDF